MLEQAFVDGTLGCLSAIQAQFVIRLFVLELNLGLCC